MSQKVEGMRLNFEYNVAGVRYNFKPSHFDEIRFARFVSKQPQSPTATHHANPLNHRLSTANRNAKPLNHQLPTANHQLPTANHQPPTTNHQPNKEKNPVSGERNNQEFAAGSGYFYHTEFISFR
jgi:FtsZ-interacting cell division protein ZipA